MKASSSIQRRINIILFAVAFMFFLVVGGLTAVIQYNKKMTAYAELMQKQAHVISHLIKTHLLFENQRLATIGQELEQVKSGDQQVIDILSHKLYPTLESNIAYVLDKNDHVILINPSLKQFVGFDLAHMPYWHKQESISSSYQSVFSSRSVIAMLYPLPHSMLLVVERDTLTLLSELDIFRENFSSQGVTFFLMDQQGLATYHPDSDVVRSRHNLAFELKIQQKDFAGLNHFIYHNQSYYGLQQKLTTPACWRLVLFTSADDLKRELLQTVLQQFSMIFLLCSLISLVLGFFLNRLFTRPVGEIIRSIEAYQKDPSGPVVVDSTPTTIAEFQQISSAINEMAEHVNSSRRQFSVILDSLDALVYVADMETYEILFVNAYGRKIWGDDIQGKTCWQALQKDQNGPCPFCTNNKLLDPDGKSTGVYSWEIQNTATKAWYDCRDQAIPWIDGHMVRMEIATDITALKTTMKELQESQGWLHSIFQTAPVGIGVVTDRVFSLVNKEVVELTGYSENELLGKKSTLLYTSDEEFNRVGQVKYEQIKEKGIGTVETQFKRKDGEVRDVLLSSSPLDRHDLSKGVLFTSLDITDRKRAEKALREQHLMTEKLVQERTVELKQKNEELERINKYYVDREFRIKELKMTIERLKNKSEKKDGELKTK